MTDASTLRELIEQHPEWADLPVAVARSDGELDYIDGSGMVYFCDFEDVDDGTNTPPTLVFSGN